jgi:hypothetical protein
VKRIDDLEQHPTRPSQFQRRSNRDSPWSGRRSAEWRSGRDHPEPARPSLPHELDRIGACATVRRLRAEAYIAEHLGDERPDAAASPKLPIYRYWKFSTGAWRVKYWSIH